jgi:hypothetical protein
MAVSVWALLIIFLFVSAFERRRLTIVESRCNNPVGVLDFKNCHPLARKDAISARIEVLARLVRSKNVKQPQACFKYVWLSHVLLLLGGDVELNPGEKVVHRQLSSYLESNGLLHDNQFGFRRGRSTEHATILFTDSVRRAVESKRVVVAVFLDLSKAFGTIGHS